MELRTRPIVESDVPFLTALYRTTREEELAMVGGITEEQKAAFIAMQFQTQHEYFQGEYPEADFDLLLEGDTPIGRSYFCRQDDVHHLIDLILHPDWRGRGVGTSLMEEILAEATKVGKPVTLYLQKTEKCWSLFERLGFRRIADDEVNFLMEWNPPGAWD